MAKNLHGSEKSSNFAAKLGNAATKMPLPADAGFPDSRGHLRGERGHRPLWFGRPKRPAQVATEFYPPTSIASSEAGRRVNKADVWEALKHTIF